LKVLPGQMATTFSAPVSLCFCWRCLHRSQVRRVL
jgi:hypothetical protein